MRGSRAGAQAVRASRGVVNFLIAHCAWSQERKGTLRAIRQSLEDVRTVAVMASEHHEHAFQWARRCWEHVADGNEPTALLNDDVILHPHFAAICEAMVLALP